MISAASNAGELAARLVRLAKSGPYIASIALNDTAKQVQEKEINHLKDKLTIRTEWFKPGRMFGVNIKFANKGNLEARVFNRAPWTVRQEEGTPRVATQGKNVVIAQEGWRGGKTAILRKAKRPKAILQKKGYFFGTSKGGTKGIWFAPQGEKPKLIFAMKPSAKGRKTIAFEATGKDEAQKRYEANYDAVFARVAAKELGVNL